MSEYIVEVHGQMPDAIYERKVGEIVRCRDCKCYKPKEGAMLSCKFEYHGFTQWKLAEPDGFCKWGSKRREVGDD